ncbi:MAG: hypothetical protein QOH41_2075 [Blastocatellia bacterium]|jgi:hypothetical protein|nr:hypothetical protein [Blastocatellia bacterium]
MGIHGDYQFVEAKFYVFLVDSVRFSAAKLKRIMNAAFYYES